MRLRFFLLPFFLCACSLTVAAQTSNQYSTPQQPCTQDMQSAGLCTVQNPNANLTQPQLGQQMQSGSNSGYINPLNNFRLNSQQGNSQTNRGMQLGSRYGVNNANGINSNNRNISNNRTNSQKNQKNMTQLPPEPLTNFQKFVASTTQQVLPIFGASLFQSVPSTFAPLNQGPVPSNYVLGPGDHVRVQVWGQVNFSTSLQVDRSGDVYLPQVGAVHLAGVPASSLQKVLREAISRVFRNFHLSASVGRIRSIQVYVVGNARRPGVYTISSLSTLIDALFASGGPSPEGSMRNIEVRRNGKIITHFDLYRLLLNGNRLKDVPLQNSDVIFIPPAGPKAAITGAVRQPAIYELRQGETLGQLLHDAGGTSTTAAKSYISIDRIVNHQDRRAIQVSFNRAGLSTPLRNGDLVRVHSIAPLFQDTVTLRGNTANPGRYAWHPGMRLSDLIPNRASLVTRNYWWRRAQLGLPAPHFEPLQSYPTLMQPNHPFNLKKGSKINLQGRQSLQQTQNQLQQQNSQQINRAASQVTSSVAAQAQVRTENTLGATPPLKVRLPAPDIDWSYAVIERLNHKTLKTELIPFDLGKLVLDHDSSQNLLLKPGDIVTIFSQGDIHVPLSQQTKFVWLEGEFKHAGVYSVTPGETLRQLVKQAGGLTPGAYLYGSSFTRVSTRVLQQERINQYVRNLSLSIQRNTLNAANSGAASAQNATMAKAARSSEQQLIARLQKVHATGRIVLNLKPNSKSVSAIPDIVLQDGDRFTVPAIPSTVNVIGAVYDQNSFLYSPHRRIGDYLRLAGGANRDADRRHEFIIRADGDVVSRSTSHTIFGNNFRSLPVYPGDTIVVPEKLYKPNRLLGVLQYSQLFSQLALGAASINVIK